MMRVEQVFIVMFVYIILLHLVELVDLEEMVVQEEDIPTYQVLYWVYRGLQELLVVDVEQLMEQMVKLVEVVESGEILVKIQLMLETVELQEEQLLGLITL
jgi:hypothetical protein